jgi:hypothetical protein
MNQSKARHSALLPIRQLPLPFPDVEPMPPPLPTQVVCLSPQHIWATLPLATRMGVRTTLLRVFQEVLNDRYRS